MTITSYIYYSFAFLFKKSLCHTATGTGDGSGNVNSDCRGALVYTLVSLGRKTGIEVGTLDYLLIHNIAFKNGNDGEGQALRDEWRLLLQ